ncbi:MAG: hypothetical protein K6G88_10615, partial [Lachnospiraceae bacterium]|nr:hypothetical protein [Lachnospiraceae bacterium]
IWELIKILKKNEGWSELGDYYIALKNIIGLIDDYCVVGEEIKDIDFYVLWGNGFWFMLALGIMDNKYAINYMDNNFELYE